MANLWTFLLHVINKINYSHRTNKVVHHLGGVVWCGGDAQKLLPFCHSGVVDCLNVDVVTRHHDVTNLTSVSDIKHNISFEIKGDSLKKDSRAKYFSEIIEERTI